MTFDRENTHSERRVGETKAQCGTGQPEARNRARDELARFDKPHEPTPEDWVKDAEAKYQKAIEILKRDVDRKRANFDPQTLARFDETLQAIDRTIAETRHAALSQGNDPVAVQYMLTAYAKKVEVLREMARN